jgi:hypothetical protein
MNLLRADLMNLKYAVFGMILTLSATCYGQMFPVVNPDEIIAAYGKPDEIKSTENATPRPQVVTRMLEYKNEHVRFILIPDGPADASPPYKTWRLLGMQDLRNNAELDHPEVERRMQKRVQK